jgi:class 3 adenylate cyclase
MAEAAESIPTVRPQERRKLIAVVYADMVGYSRLIGLDDAGTLARLKALRANLIDPAIDEHGGRIVQTGGDSLLIVFDSIDGAMRCAVKVQQRVPVLDGDQPPDRAMRFRVGIDIGDAIADGTDLHGDAVNVVARLQGECPSGGVCVSRSVRDHVGLDLTFEELGALRLTNIARPVEAFVVRLDGGLEVDKPPAELAAAHPSNLPHLAHALIGRERDVAEIEALLSSHRLVTLVGTGGIGKTSLSLQMAADLLARFPDGTWFVELAPLARAELVGEAVAAVFGLPVHGHDRNLSAIKARAPHPGQLRTRDCGYC